ncbi:MAG: archaeosortase/exosortase family protein [Verrucomicrobiota bacterium]|jgi:exosortase C (VPDSG-CTERM-specific)
MENADELVAAGDSQKTSPAPGAPRGKQPGGRKRLAVLAALTGVLALCFIVPLYDWAWFAMDSDFYSYMPLMPLITGYLIWLRRAGLGVNAGPSRGAAAAAAAAGGAILALYWLARQRGWYPGEADYLAVMMLAFLLLLLAAGLACLGAATITAMAFPLAMLLFMVPYPEVVNNGIESFFQHTSTAAAHGLFSLAGTGCVQDGLILNLPTNFSLRVGPECSGIHSSQVLLITSLLAGNLFLHSPWRRAFLAVFVIPLAIARNGFRIFVIGELCVHVNHNMIDSWIHHQGGPVFFALSLLPFFLLLVWLRKSESKTQNTVKI